MISVKKLTVHSNSINNDGVDILAQKFKSREERRASYAQLKDLRRDMREREKSVLQSLLANASLVFSTLSGAGSSMLKNQKFDVVVIDEAAQAIEAECYVAALFAQKVPIF
jgi:DNA polymerase alpha-associated DNA helicase A